MFLIGGLVYLIWIAFEAALYVTMFFVMIIVAFYKAYRDTFDYGPLLAAILAVMSFVVILWLIT